MKILASHIINLILIHMVQNRCENPSDRLVLNMLKCLIFWILKPPPATPPSVYVYK